MQEFKLPDLGEGMQEAEIRRWLVQPGDTVRLDQPMVEVETDKAVVEIPSPVAGRIAAIRVAEGQTAKLGEVLVTFESPAAVATATAAAPSSNARASATSMQAGPTTATMQTAPATTQAATQTGVPTARGQRVLAAPAVRKRAFELGIELAQVPSSQASGRITLDDVLSYAERMKNAAPSQPAPAPAATPTVQVPAQVAATNGASSAARPATQRESVPAAAEERQPLTGLRKRIAEHMERSWRIVPHATAFDELDGTELVALRQALKPVAEQRGTRLTYMPLLVKLLLPVLKEFPIFNASLDEEKREIIYKRAYHIGIATDSPEGLLVPVLRDADKLTLLQIARQLEHLIEGAQKRTLPLNEVAGSTFTLNNVGSFGGSGGTPIINYPEVAILAVGRLQEKAIVRNGSLIARTMMPLSLSFDHRVIDGALAGRFLARFRELVEHPQQLMLDMI
jgi:pyruvate dehydrogenase E2 component (dihydrolipoamide acetyltransferase)